MNTEQKPLFSLVDSRKSVLSREKEVQKYWKENNIFKKTIAHRRENERYSFFDGPPFATGTPHYGHLVASVIKDTIPRYWTMRGKYVERRWGWDCHGLPIENIVEKELGSKSKKDIEQLGIEAFNARCRDNVFKYVSEWEKIIDLFGRWADMDDPYRTMDPEYMESVWWVFGELWKKGYIYEGYRSMHICPRCETTLSQSEVAEGYLDIKDLSVTVKFELEDEPQTYILAWTTTPWTILGNVALAVGKDIEYCRVQIKAFDGETFIIAKNRLSQVLGGFEYEMKEEFFGEKLLGKSYRPIFPFSNTELKNKENGWKIYHADFVTTDEGAGVVHIAPAFGEDDMNIGKTNNLPFVQHVGKDGIILDGFGEFSGQDIKLRAKGNPKDVREIDIFFLKALQKSGGYFSHAKYEHSYPHCWRCDTALLNYATGSWFVAVEKIKEKCLTNAQDIHWVPEHIKEGRFGNWLSGARDWSISRQRFWASVMPIWKCEDCSKTRVISSVMEIASELGGVNRLYLVRHAQALSNVELFLDSQGDPKNTLTQNGIQQVEEAGKELSTKFVDIIITSPLTRARQTAEIIATIGEKEVSDIIEDDRLRETSFGVFEGKKVQDIRKKYPNVSSQKENTDQVETFEDILKRARLLIKDINAKYSGKTIVLVGHQDSLLAIEAILSNKEDLSEQKLWHAQNAQIRSIFSKKVDIHRPYIDEVTLPCECGGKMNRIPDVLDTWFDSGSMPYAQLHYPFENEKKFQETFPADFIAEGVDQTRAWFYYLHVLASGIEEKRAFSHVIVNGIVLAQDGKKMSKKLKNYPDPSGIIEKYGADTLRMYLLGSPVVMAENLNFSEKDIAEIFRGMFRMLQNTYAFFTMYANVDGFLPQDISITPVTKKKKHVLDRWLLSKFWVLTKKVNEAMELYELARATRYFAPFVDDLSNWYIRRSRKRFWKSENDADKKEAYETLYYVLVEFSKLLAPFAPFISEEIYRNLTKKESVHLEDYPQTKDENIDEEVLQNMDLAREYISKGLQKRAEAGIEVRRPLASVTLPVIISSSQYKKIIKEELNVKKVICKEDEKCFDVELDTNITPELKLEGLARTIIRVIQEMRNQAKYDVENRIHLGYVGAEEVFSLFGASLIAKETLAKEVISGRIENADAEKEITVNDWTVILTIKKVEK
ncbi:MAG: class I tRNA ligase family protein [Candidatus Moraniibacteriota bacterium]|nr:MAG: class I tRNA ligase family protein [Candidatus Moranbacteria bacterium]